MSITFLNQLGIIPALLVALAGALMLRGETENAKRRLLMFLLGLGVLMLSALYVTMRFVTEPYEQPFFVLSNLLSPSLLGMLALILLNIRGVSAMSRGAKIAATLLGMTIVVLFSLLWNTRFSVEYLILPGMLVLAIGWAFLQRYSRLAIVLTLLSVVVFLWFNWLMSHPPNYSDNPVSQVIGTWILLPAFYVIPGLAVVASAVLITKSLSSSDIRFGRIDLIRLGLAILLPAYLAYTIFWGSVWDQTSDGLFGIFILTTSGLVAIGGGMLMTLTLRGRHRLAGLFFIVVVPLLLYQSFEAGWRVSYHAITEKRVARIAEALDRFHAREGHYPESLDKLTPRDLLFVQQPILLAGEGWCYESGEDYYRLSAFYREFFSAPVSLKIYKSAGELPDGPPTCEERLVEMKEKYYSPMEDPNAMRPPVPTPLPEVEVGLPKTEIQPVMNDRTALLGSWSPDGAYLVFGTQPSYLAMHFLNGKTGDICTVDAHFSQTDGIREKYVWLADGRLLFADASGELAVLTPCQLDVEQLTDRLPDTFNQIGAYAPETGRILLQSKDAFWILDGRTLEVQLIPDVTPNPYELHWDRAVWLRGGEKLLIARLNGRSGDNEGVTFYLVDGATRTVQNSFVLDGDFGQGAPWVEALSETEVLIHGQGELLIADFSANPVKTTNVLEEFFGLDIRYPDEVSAAGSYPNNDGHGYYLSVRLNHSRNQATYLYDSDTGSVHVYDHEYHTLLLFPDGYSMEMPKQETTPTYRDEYDIVMVSDPETVQPKLKFAGHTPREYPHLSIEYLPGRSQLAVASAHGVSLLSLPDGQMEKYWTLAGDGFSPWLIAAPDGSALIAFKDFGGLYYIPLP